MKNLWLGIFFCISFYHFDAQEIQVVDELGSPVSEALIEFYPQQEFVETNPYGEFKVHENFEFESFTIFHPNFENTKMTYEEWKQNGALVIMYSCELSLDGIVFSASRFYEKKSQIPQYIESIRSTEIELQNAPSTAEVLSNSGKVFVQKSQQGGGSPNIRGFEANKVLLVTDGVRMNNAIFRGGHLQNIITLNANAIDNVEVLYGSGSVIYGSDALGGVVHVSTTKPFLNTSEKKLSAKLYGRYSTAANEKTAGVRLNYGNEKWASFTSFNFSSFDDLRQGANRNSAMGNLGLRPSYAINDGVQDIMVENSNPNVQKYSGYEQYNLIQKVLFKPSEKYQHKLNIQYSTSSDVPRYDRLSEIAEDGNQNNAEWYYGPQDWFLTSYELQENKNRKIADQINLITAFQLFEESRHTRKFNNADRRNQFEKVQVWSLNANAKKTLGQHSIKYGLDAYFNFVDSKAHYNNIYTGARKEANTRYPDGGSTMHTFGAYVSHQNSFKNAKFFMSEGLRFTYTDLNSQFENKDFFPFPYDDISQKTSNVSGFLGMVYLPNDKFRLALNANTGFRTPNVDDVGKVFDSTPGNVIIPNPNLTPEKTIGFDFAISKVFDSKLKLETIFFYTLFRDIITTQDSTYNGSSTVIYDGVESQVQQQQNEGKANMFGFNMNVEFNFSKSIKLNGALSYTHGEVKADEPYPLDHIPPLFGKVNIQYKKKKWLAQCYTLFNAKKPINQYNPFGEDNDQYATPEGMPSWWTLNLKTSYSVTKNSTLNLGLENILDRNYRVFSSGISAPGRNFVVSYRLSL